MLYFETEVDRTNLEDQQRVISPETPLCTYDRKAPLNNNVSDYVKQAANSKCHDI
jgi:hypothetical protein